MLSSIMLRLGLFPVFSLVWTRNAVDMENFDFKSDPENHQVRGRAKSAELSEALRAKEYWFLSAAVFITGLAAAGIGLHIVPYLVDQGLAADAAVGAVSIRFFASALGGFVAGMVVDRFSPRLVVIVAMVIRAVSIFVLIYTTNLFEAYISAALGGFSEGAQSTGLVVLLVSYFGRSHVGGIYGLNRALTVVGFAAGPMIAGITFDLVGSYFFVFWSFLILTIIGIALIINAKQTTSNYYVSER